MRRFEITSANFAGKVMVSYSMETLESIDFTESTMTPDQKTKFKAMVPVPFPLMEEFSSRTGVQIVESTYEVSFDQFWDRYKHKINRKRAQALWGHLRPSDRVASFHGIPKYEAFLKREGGWRTKKDPENYLRDRLWESEF